MRVGDGLDCRAACFPWAHRWIGSLERVLDMCEFLRSDAMDRMASILKPLSACVIYRGPCQLRGQKSTGVPCRYPIETIAASL